MHDLFFSFLFLLGSVQIGCLFAQVFMKRGYDVQAEFNAGKSQNASSARQTMVTEVPSFTSLCLCLCLSLSLCSCVCVLCACSGGQKYRLLMRLFLVFVYSFYRLPFSFSSRHCGFSSAQISAEWRRLLDTMLKRLMGHLGALFGDTEQKDVVCKQGSLASADQLWELVAAIMSFVHRESRQQFAPELR